MAVILNKSYLSLQRGRMFQLTSDVPVTWSTSNPNVRVTAEGLIYAVRADKLRPDGQATITATAEDNSTATCKVTIVNWKTNKYDLTCKEVINLGIWMAKDRNNDAFYTSGTGIYRIRDNHFFGKPPTYPESESFIDTPFGYFYRENNCKVYMSQDLITWELIFTPIDPSTDKISLQNSFPWWYDEATGKGYVFIAEYSLVFTTRHKLYRITINADGTYSSDVVLEFYSRDEWRADNTKIPACEHIHSTCIDPYTGYIWVGVGDAADYAGWRYSTNKGDTWNVFALGDAEKYRSLSMWFTENYIYWNMDSSNPQHIFRIKKSDMADINKRETVAKLDNGSMWYYVWAKDTEGKDFVLMAQAAEGQIRDWLARVYGIWELEDGTNIVEELICLPSTTPDVLVSMVQLEPKFVIGDSIYFKTRSMAPSGFWRMELAKSPAIDNKAFVRKLYKNFRAKFTDS